MDQRVHSDTLAREIAESLRELQQRVKRTETRLTAMMRYQGFHSYRDCQATRKAKVAVATDKDGVLELHATGPDVPLAWLFQAMLDADVLSANLYVNGLHRGRIKLDDRGEDE